MIKDLYRRGVSISDIARVTGHDRKTIRGVVQGPVISPPRVRRARASRLDPFVSYLERRLAEGVLNCNKLLEEIRPQGYEGGKSLLKSFVQPYREARRAEATVRFETQPGEQAQVDWGSFGFIEHHGRRRRLYAFVMTLGWSRMMYVEFTTSMDTATWLRCHVHAWHYFGGVPRVVLHDNLKTAVLDRRGDGAVHWNPRYLDLADYYGFSLRACQPYRAQTKGKVESGIRYLRGNFWPGLRFVDLSDLNQQGRDWLDLTANQRVHGTTGEVPFARLPEELLQPLADKPDYDTSLIGYRRASKDCFVSYGGNYYTVPFAYVRQTLQVKETEDGHLVVQDAQGTEIARHRLAHGFRQRVAISAHYEQLRAAVRPSHRPLAIQTPQAVDWASLPEAPEVESRPLSWYDHILEVAR
jgi:transposase